MWAHIAALVLLAVGIAQASVKTQRMSKSLMDACFPEMPMEKLNHWPDRNMHIFLDFEFTCGGEIAAWNFYAQHKGHFYASVWRKHADGRLEMIGKNYVEADRTGLQTYFIPRHLRFKVSAGDVLGIHYENKNGRSVIMFEDDTKKNVDNTIKLSTSISIDKMYDSELSLGHEFSNIAALSAKGKRAPSLFPVFNKNRLRLDGGKDALEGRAMFQANGEWGTICDAYFVERGWPDVFCKELGYDHCELSEFAIKTYVGAGKGNIGYQKPACPLTGNIFMDECGKDKGTCGHDVDVFVRCAYAVKLEDGRTAGEGRAMSVNNSFKWGTICDKSKTLSTTAWASALCNEIGFSHAVKVEKASKSYVGKGHGAVNLETPTCQADKPYQLKHCAKEGAKCGHIEDVFVECKRGVRLSHGHKQNEGIAEVFMNGRWGSVCLDTVRRGMFPSVFCKELGYDRAASVKYARNAYTGQGTGVINMMNPDCNPENAANVLNCGHPTKTKCGHNKDIFIECAYNDLCKSNPCQNDAICIDMENDYKCECTPGFSGPNCEDDIDECKSNPCSEGSKCLDKHNGFECKCNDKRFGPLCQYVYMPKDPVTIRSFDEPTKNIYAQSSKDSTGARKCILSKSSLPFVIQSGLIRKAGTVSIMSVNHNKSYLTVNGNKLFLKPLQMRPTGHASFYPEESSTHKGYFMFRSYANQEKVIVHHGDLLMLESEKKDDADFLKKALFYIHELDAQNSIVLYSNKDFKGQNIILTESDDNLHEHGFDNKMDSFVIHGTSAWQLFDGRNFNGKSVIAKPGRYNMDWVNTNIKTNKVSSVKRIEVQDGLILWEKKGFKGTFVSLASTTTDISRKSDFATLGSVEVAGPSSWELYSKKNFKGTKVVVAPGRFPYDWVKDNLQTVTVQSARKVEKNTPMCRASSGSQKIAGNSGREHDAFVVHRQDGSVWLRFGKGNQSRHWAYKSRSNGKAVKNIISENEIETMKDFNFIGWEVQTDVNLQMSVDNSWHPSKINVMYLGSKVEETLSFKKRFSDRTDITFAADKAQIACNGRVKDGKVLSNLCDDNGLPAYGTSTRKLLIRSIDMTPRGVDAYAKDRDFTKNAFTWSGSHYYVYAKLANCASSTGCYKRRTGVSFVFGKVEAKKDNRPETFYFGQMAEDADKCEAACRDEPDCVAYTLFKKGDTDLQGGCYGVAKSQFDSAVTQKGAFSGKAMKCGTFIPEYMEDDMWTKNTTGCPCSFDTSRTDCACCHEGACQCEHRYKYQCTLCGFHERCGSPFLTTSNGEYIFEYTNQQLSSHGHHYKVPDLCVSGCHMDVRATDSAASEVAAFMTDYNDNRVLSCVASGLGKSNKAITGTDGTTSVAEGVRISRVSLYSFGGIGEMIKLRLKVKKNGCPTEERDVRYVGCYAMDYTVKNENSTEKEASFTSTHMTRGTCIRHCYNIGSTYAMLENGKTCKCVEKTPVAGPSFSCDTFCSGDATEVCGGRHAHSVFVTELKKRMILVATAPGKCASVGGKRLAHLPLQATGDNCRILTGANTHGDTVAECSFDWCEVEKVTIGGLFASRPGSCGSHKRGEAFVRTRGADCLDMGGSPDYEQTEWGLCKLDFCTTNKPKRTIYSPVPAQSCPAYVREAEIEVKATHKDCMDMGGAVRDETVGEDEMTYCQLEMCAQDRNPMRNKIYKLPQNNEVVSEGATHFFTLPEMCVTECQFAFKATTKGSSIAEATLLGDDNKEAGLDCGGKAVNFKRMSFLSFAKKATGVKVSGIQITARNSSFIMKNLILRINPDGCRDDEDMIVLYNKPNFGGRPKVIKDDIEDLGTVEFNNKVVSFKIYGNKMWEMFEHKEFNGRSAVLATGEYYDTSVLPFGDKDVSSVRMVGTMNANMDKTRQEISNARGLVCFKRTPKSSAVFGLPPNSPGGENRPRVFFFGNFGNNIDKCERACRAEPQCAAFTLFSMVADGALKDWRGLCYGRSFSDDVQVYQEDVMSGYVASCAEEDTLTLYTEKEYAGASLTIIEDTVNVTLSPGPFSAMITGKDSWRIITESDGHIHTYKLGPGDYSDLSATFVGKVFQVSKMHPNTQLYKSQHNYIDLAPVAINQISKTITKVKVKVGYENKTETVCNTTKEAEVFFVLDASSSVFQENYEKMLDFVADVVDSFALGVDQVRVGVLIYSYYTHMDIKLGEHTDIAALQKSIKELTYYTGGTYTHSALQAIREEGLNDANVREGVSKQAIVITDGESRRPERTSEQAHLCRDDGIVLTAVGIKGANYEELHNIAGDASRVYNVTDFDELRKIISAIEETTCTAVNQGNVIWNETEHVTITVQGNDTNYFVHEDPEFKRKPVPLGMESGVIYNRQIFASSSLFGYEAHLGRLNHNSGWKTTIGNHTNKNEWIEIDLGKILPIHGISTQGHAVETAWVTKYKIAISLDGIHFVTFKDLNSTLDLIFLGNIDQGTIKYHCLHRLFGQAIMARVIRFIVVEWHVSISMRIELYGFRDADDSQLVEALRKDVWTRNVTGCPCYFDSSRKDCACCEDGGCQCPNTDRHQCVQCGYPHMCGTPNLRNPVNNIDGWTSSLSGCRCTFDPLRTDCACCQSYGCQCGGGNKNQCVNCGHPEHCGLKEHIFGPNPYCKPQTCPKKINTIWEGPAPHGINPGDTNPVVQEVESKPFKQASE